jgi:hypothetical protein
MQRRRSGRLAHLLAAALACVPLFGCQIVTVTVRIPDFDQVNGIWLWRLSDAGQYQRSGRLQFSPPQQGAQGEVLLYKETCANGVKGIANQAWMQRAPDDPSTVTLSLHYLNCEQPGTYRATAFNDAGESNLSVTSVTF